MSPTSYQLLYPAMLSAKVRRIFLKSKFSCRTLLGSTRLCRPPTDCAWSCSSQQTSAKSADPSRLRQNQRTPAKSAKPANPSGVCRLQQSWQNQRTLIWLSILARTLALVQSLSLDSRTVSSLWPYPPTIDRSRPRQNRQSQQSRQSQQTQRTLIWLSILARTLALVQSLSLDSRTASSLWPYPPTIDRTLSSIVCGRG